MAPAKAPGIDYHLEHNWQRAILFLEITMQQIRSANEAVSNRLDRQYVQPLKHELRLIFANGNPLESDAYTLVGNQLYENIIDANTSAGARSSASVATSESFAPASGLGGRSASKAFDEAFDNYSVFPGLGSNKRTDTERSDEKQPFNAWNSIHNTNRSSNVKSPPGLSGYTYDYFDGFKFSSPPLGVSKDSYPSATAPRYTGNVAVGDRLSKENLMMDMRDRYSPESYKADSISMGHSMTSNPNPWMASKAGPISQHQAINLAAPYAQNADRLSDTTSKQSAAEPDQPAKANKQIDDNDLRMYLESKGWSVSKGGPATAKPASKDIPSKSVRGSSANGKEQMNWAKIAAISNAGSNADEQFGNVKPPPPSKARPLGMHQMSFDRESLQDDLLPASTVPSDPSRESYAQTLRVVWVYGLPPVCEVTQVSGKIIEGPLMSISILQDVAEHIPGKSACIIFQHAMDAVKFLRANGCEITLFASIDATELQVAADEIVDSRPPPLVQQDPMQPNRFVKSKDAPNATLVLGGSYPYSASPFLRAMDTHRARRRLKWARKGLFQSVSLINFKRDVIKLAGGQDKIEFFHFFNAGECTVVFDSVQTAILVYTAFEAWRKGRKTPQSILDMLARKSSPSIAARQLVLPGPVTGGIGKGGKGGGPPKKPAAAAKQALSFPMGKYEGTDVGYCKDFNEDPCAHLVSTYVHGGQGTTVGGINGIFQGPRVASDTL